MTTENIPTPSVTNALAENGLLLSLKYPITEKYTIHVDDSATIGTFLHWIYVTQSRSDFSMQNPALGTQQPRHER